MLDRLSEQRSGRVDTFLITEWPCEGAEGSLGNSFVETPEDSSLFLLRAPSE